MPDSHYGQHSNCQVCNTWRAINQIANENPEIAALFPRSARWRYYGPRGALGSKPADVYFYTTERIKGKYQSGVYRYVKTRKIWKATQIRKHSRRKDAMARAFELWQDRITLQPSTP